MLLDSYEAFRTAISRATALELAGVIHLASERLRMLTSAPQCEPAVAVVGETHAIATVPTEVCIYLAGASGLKDRARELGKPICKIGTTSRGDASARIDDLSKIRYGGHDPLAGGHRQGFDDYRLTPFRRPAEALPPAVRLSDGCLWVQLPQGTSRGAFECRFRAFMKEHAVEYWSQTSAGLRYLAERGLQRECLPVATWHAHGAVRAKELYCLPLSHATMAAAMAADSALKGRSHADQP